MTERVILAGLRNQGFQKITTNSTAQGLNSTVVDSQVIDISVETANVRYRMDSTAPTRTTGVIMWAGTTYRFEGFNSTANLKFIATTSTAATINIQGYKIADNP